MLVDQQLVFIHHVTLCFIIYDSMGLERSHPPLAVVGRTKILNIATMLVGFSNPICTLPDMFEKNSVGKMLKKWLKMVKIDPE